MDYFEPYTDKARKYNELISFLCYLELQLYKGTNPELIRAEIIERLNLHDVYEW